MKTGRNRKTRTGCTGTSLTCTDTSWPKMTRTDIVPVQAQIVPVQVFEPTTYQEVMLDPDSEKWLEAMKSEIQSMYDN